MRYFRVFMVNHAAAARRIAITAAPTAIPAVAPVLRPLEAASVVAVVVGEGVVRAAVPVVVGVDVDDDDDVREALDVATIVTGNCVVANFFPDSDTAGPMSNTAPGVAQQV